MGLVTADSEPELEGAHGVNNCGAVAAAVGETRTNEIKHVSAPPRCRIAREGAAPGCRRHAKAALLTRPCCP